MLLVGLGCFLPHRPQTFMGLTAVLQDLLDMMIAEEESLKERLIKSIANCQKELATLCRELGVEPFQVHGRVLGSCSGLRFREGLCLGAAAEGVCVGVLLGVRSGGPLGPVL